MRRADGRESQRWDDRRRANYQKRRAQKRGTQVETVRPAEIYERDSWVCGICEGAVDASLAHPDPMSASLDHVVPLAKGGTHTWDNLQLAHLRCNVVKSDSLAC